MDMTYDEYINFLNHLFLQEFLDFDFQFNTGSTCDALEVIE